MVWDPKHLIYCSLTFGKYFKGRFTYILSRDVGVCSRELHKSLYVLFLIEYHENFTFKNTGVSPEARKFIRDEPYFWSVRHVLWSWNILKGNKAMTFHFQTRRHGISESNPAKYINMYVGIFILYEYKDTSLSEIYWRHLQELWSILNKFHFRSKKITRTLRQNILSRGFSLDLQKVQRSKKIRPPNLD